MATAKDDQPFLVTRNFAYDEATHTIYMHGAKKGRTYFSAKNGPRVCFSASEAGRLLPAKRAMNFGTEFGGVVAFGRLNLVEDFDEVKHGLQLLCDKYFPQLKPVVDYETPSDSDLKVTAVLRIDIESWSGKERKAPEEVYRKITALKVKALAKAMEEDQAEGSKEVPHVRQRSVSTSGPK